MTAQVEEVLMDPHPLDSYRQFKGVWVKKSWLLHNHSYSINSYIILEKQNYKIHNHLGNETVSTSAKSCIKTSRSGLADNLPTFNVKQQRKVFHSAQNPFPFTWLIKPNKNYLWLGMFIGWQNHQFNSNRSANLFCWKYLYAMHNCWPKA